MLSGHSAGSDCAAVLIKLVMTVPRSGTTDEVTAMVDYLAGPEAGYATGASPTIGRGFNT